MRYKEAPIGPKKKMVKPAKRVSQRLYNADKEEYDEKKRKKDLKGRKPSDIADALNKAKEGYSKKPRVKPSTKKKP